MNDLRKLVIMLFALAITVVTQILVMIHGWGMEPLSWFWIVGVYLFGGVVSVLLIKLAD